MTASRVALASLVFAACAFSIAFARVGQLSPVPAPAPVRMPIEGFVSITNTPEVHVVNVPQVAARQDGRWAVEVSDLPPLRVGAPTFLSVGSRYSVLWPGASKPEVYRVVQIRSDGWVQVEAAEPKGPEPKHKEAGRWINPALAAVIAEVRTP